MRVITPMSKAHPSGSHWEQNAVEPSHEGKFTAKAKRAGKSVHEYAVEEQHAPGTLGKEARLALTFEKQ